MRFKYILFWFQISHRAVMDMCRAHKHISELYPSRDVLLCLDPFSGFGLVLWIFARSVLYMLGHTHIDMALGGWVIYIFVLWVSWESIYFSVCVCVPPSEVLRLQHEVSIYSFACCIVLEKQNYWICKKKNYLLTWLLIIILRSLYHNQRYCQRQTGQLL